MQTIITRGATAALLMANLGAAAMAAPSFRVPLKKAVQALQGGIEEEKQVPYQWMLPSAIQAGLVQKEASFVIGDSYSSFEGRSFEMKTVQVGAGITDWLQVLYGEQTVLAKGRSSGSRFDVFDSYYAVRGVVKKPTATDPSALSLQFEALRPDTGSAHVGSAVEDFAGTHNNIGSVNYQDRRSNLFQFQYTNVDGPASVNAHVYNFGYGHDLDIGSSCLLRLQGSLIAESFQAVDSSSNFEMRPMIYGCIAYRPDEHFSFEMDLTAFPAGVPLAGGDFTAISSFALYNPGGVVDNLRSDFSLFGSIRAMYHVKF